MISHDRAQELISARMDTPLTPAEHRELQGHLASCTACRDFVMQSDEIARSLQLMPRLGPSPIVSREVMAAISAESTNWGWLGRALQTLSSPGMAVASSLALVVALPSALLVALNAPGGNNPGQGVEPQGTLAALVEQPFPTEVPTVAPTAKPTEPRTLAQEQTTGDPTPPAGRTISTKTPTQPTTAPTPRPTATAVPIVPVTAGEQVPNEAPVIAPSDSEVPVEEAPVNDPSLAMAGEPEASADLAQAAEPVVEEQPAENVDTGEAVEPAPSEAEPVAETDNTTQEGDGGRKDNGRKDTPEEVATEPEPTRPIGPVPAEAIRALEGAGGAAPDIHLPPAPIDPLLPDQSFLPETPSPEWEGTPTPESDPATESEAPQLAEDWSDELDIADLAPEAPVLAEAPDVSTSETEKRNKDGEKRDKSSKDGNSHEQQQAAFIEEPMAWSGQPIEPQQSAEQPVELQQTTDVPADAATTTTGEATDPAATSATEPVAAGEPERQIDPATGMEIDPATGYLIDPTTGYLLDVVNDRIIDPRTSFEVHPMTGLLIEPATGALLDPNTLVVVIPPGFGDDQPQYVPGSDEMHGDIETVVDDTYNSASIQLIPPTDGPVQPVGEIVVPTESGEAVEIS
jgi:hypothetical protein